MKILILLFTILFVHSDLKAQLTYSNAEMYAESGAGVTTFYSLWLNPAGLNPSQDKDLYLRVRNYWSFTDLHHASLACKLPDIKRFSTGVCFEQFGDEWLNQQSLSWTFSHGIENIRLGLRLKAFHFQFYETKNRLALNLDFGGQIKLKENLSLGMYIQDLYPNRLSAESKETTTTTMRLGLAYHTNKNILFFDVMSRSEQNLIILMGLIYALNEKIKLRATISSQQRCLNLASQFSHKKIKFSYISEIQQALGFSHKIELRLRLFR